MAYPREKRDNGAQLKKDETQRGKTARKRILRSKCDSHIVIYVFVLSDSLGRVRLPEFCTFIGSKGETAHLV